MSIPVVSLDETAPAGSESLNQGDNRIREYKTQNRQVLDVDHNYPTSGQSADAGKHKKVSLLEQADLGTGAEGKPILGAQTIGGKAELVFTDEDNNDIQLTNAGKINGASVGITAVPATAGGTGQTTIAQGELLYASAADVISKLGVGTAGMFLKTFGAAANPQWAYAPDFIMGQVTYNIATAPGTVNSAAIGFTPRFVIFIVGIHGASSQFCGIGFDNGGATQCGLGFSETGNGMIYNNASSIQLSSGAAFVTGKITSLADPFVMTFTKTGSPTGTVTIGYLAVR